jgi:hypothetical protein
MSDGRAFAGSYEPDASLTQMVIGAPGDLCNGRALQCNFALAKAPAVL